MAPTNIKIGECDFCGTDNVALYPRRSDQMCSACIAKEDAVVVATQVITQSQAKDAKVELNQDVMSAATTSFIELHGAIESNPAISAEDKRYALADLAVARIAQFDKAIFAQEQQIMAMRNERMAWIKNTQSLVSTLREDRRAKYASVNINYKPQTPVIKPKAKSDVPKGHANRPITSGSKHTHQQLIDACAKYKVDLTSVKMKLVSPSGRNMSPMEAAKFIADRSN